MKRVIFLLFLSWNIVQANNVDWNDWRNEMIRAIQRTDLPTFNQLLNEVDPAELSDDALRILLKMATLQLDWCHTISEHRRITEIILILSILMIGGWELANITNFPQDSFNLLNFWLLIISGLLIVEKCGADPHLQHNAQKILEKLEELRNRDLV